MIVPDGLACCIIYNSFSNSCLQKSCPPRRTNSAPFTKGWQHTTQTKHCRWNTCDWTLITSARGSSRSPHREHFTPNFLQYKQGPVIWNKNIRLWKYIHRERIISQKGYGSVLLMTEISLCWCYHWSDLGVFSIVYVPEDLWEDLKQDSSVRFWKKGKIWQEMGKERLWEDRSNWRYFIHWLV